MKYDRNKKLLQVQNAEPYFQYEILSTRDSVPTLVVQRENRTVYFHSKFSPLREASKIANSLSPDASVIIIAGFGLGYHIQSIFQRTTDTKFLILEKDPFFIKLALQENDSIQTLLDNDRVFLFFNPDELLDSIGTVSTKKINYFFHRSAVELFPDFYEHFRSLLIPALQKKNINMATLSRFQKLWAKNIAENLPCYLHDKGVKEVFGLYKDKPVLLIGAGPSFEDNLSLIKKIKDKAVIVAVDSIAGRLLHENIEPDFIVSVDPQIINYYFFYLFRHRNFSSVLVYEPSVNFLIPRTFKKTRLVFDSIFPIMKWIEKYNDTKGSLDMGGSVSTTAFDFAVKLGGNPIFLIGQDMAFLYNQTHAHGSFAEYYLLKKNNRLQTFETLSFRYANSNLHADIKSNAGDTVFTDKRLLLFYRWFNKKISALENIAVYNLAEHGARIDGARYAAYNEVLQIFNNYHVLSKTKLSFRQEQGQIHTLFFETESVLQVLENLDRLMSEAVDLSNKLYGYVKLKRNQNLRPLIARLDEIDKIIEMSKQENQFIGITMQRAIFSILEDYEDYLTEQEKTDKDLGVIRKSVLIYTELQKSIRYNLKLFKLILRQLTLLK